MNDQPTRVPSDTQLLEQITARNSDALSTLYDRFSKLLYGIILSVVRNTDDAEDILQEVFIQVWRSAGTYQPMLGTPKTWLVRLAHNRAIDLLRSKRHKQKKMEVSGAELGEGEIRIPQEYIADATWQTAMHREQRGFISNALLQIPKEQRLLIELAFLEGYTHQEIAQRTGIPLGTVKTRIRTGMQGLRSYLRFIEEEI